MTSSRRKEKTKASRFDLSWIPEKNRERYASQLREQGVDATKLRTVKTSGRYRVAPAIERQADGITFDSKWERDCYLMLTQALGRDRVKLQVPFILQDAFDFEGKKIKATSYVADFVVDSHVCDAKGHQTKEFKDKQKRFIFRYQKPLNLFFNVKDVKDFLLRLDSKS
jgi:hypothetical protein